MKLLALYSSPKKPSNSSFLLDTIVEAALATGKHSVAKIDLVGMDIKPCRGCKACFTNAAKACVLKDDYHIIAEAIAEADYIFMASPLYWWSISTPLKAVIDRSYPPPYEKFRGKTIHLVMTGLSPTDDDGYRLCRETFNCICDYIGADFKSFFVSAYDDDNPAQENQEAIAAAKAIGQSL